MNAEVYWIPGPWPGRLGILPRPRGGDWLSDEVRRWREANLDLVVSLLTPEEVVDLGLREEETLAREQGVEFYAFPIPDRGVPGSHAEMDALTHVLGRALQSGKSVGVHCRQGIGRSSLMAASLLVSAGDRPERAFHSVERARGVPVPETREQREWVEHSALAEDSLVMHSP